MAEPTVDAAAERGASVIGVDIAEGMLSLARRLHPQLDFRIGDAESLPFADEREFAALLRDQGLADIDVRTISFSHAEPSADALWRGLLGGTVRTSALVLRQSEAMQRQIRAAFDRIVQPYEAGAGLELPVSVKLASGRKPR